MRLFKTKLKLVPKITEESFLKLLIDWVNNEDVFKIKVENPPEQTCNVFLIQTETSDLEITKIKKDISVIFRCASTIPDTTSKLDYRYLFCRAERKQSVYY